MPKVRFFDEDPPYFEMDDAEISKKPIRIDVEFVDRKNCGGKSDFLAKAIGWKRGQAIRVFDGTVGLGRDLSHLLALGCEVIGCEKHPDLFRAVSRAIPGVELIQGDSLEVLTEMVQWGEAERPQVVYLDPMFPERKKAARPAKESALLQALHGPTVDDEMAEVRMLKAALLAAQKRVVVKRPVHAPDYGRRKANFTFRGKAVRFDVYLKGPTKE